MIKIKKLRTCGKERALKEACGVVGVFSKHKKDVKELTLTALHFLQHRGQDSAGLVTFNGREFYRCKVFGPVSSIREEKNYEFAEGHAAIGHTRYSTVGSSYAPQPVEVKHPLGGIALAHNGNIVNYEILKEELESKGYGFDTDIDAETILYAFVDEYYNTKNEIRAIENTMKRLDGAYSVVMLTGEDKLFAFRDPLGIRPLVYGYNDDTFIVASETVSLDMLRIPVKGDVPPGSVIIVREDGFDMINLFETQHHHCMFEWLYFARPDSVIEGRNVYTTRVRIGRFLAKVAPVNADYVIPVPDTSRPYSIGYSEESGIPYREGLIPDRYSGRTFIQPYQNMREKNVRLKFNVVRENVEGKRLVVIDDSIVRGTTAKKLVALLREFGAKEVHLRIATPRIIAPCFYGINISSYDELASFRFDTDELCRWLGADSLAFLNIEDLIKGIGLDDLCISCLIDSYPTETAQEMANKMKQESKQNKN